MSFNRFILNPNVKRSYYGDLLDKYSVVWAKTKRKAGKKVKVKKQIVEHNNTRWKIKTEKANYKRDYQTIVWQIFWYSNIFCSFHIRIIFFWIQTYSYIRSYHFFIRIYSDIRSKNGMNWYSGSDGWMDPLVGWMYKSEWIHARWLSPWLYKILIKTQFLTTF